MAMALMELDVRKSLNREPMLGIYPEGRPSLEPTGRAIIASFEELTVVIMKHNGE